MRALRRDDDRVSFEVRITPRASSNVVAGVRDGVLLVRVMAPPVGGEANAALVALLARAIGVPRGSIRIEHGRAGRSKRVSVPRHAVGALGAVRAR